MSGNSGDWIGESFDQSWENGGTEFGLEVFGHVVTDLSDAMKSSVSNSWVLMFQMSNNDWNHSSDL